MKSHFRFFYKRFHQVFVHLTRPINEFLESECPPVQLIEEWGVVSYFSLMALS
ncbi:hypothetical protein Goari_021348 [Gossypium aridum]|uniref:Uncharacterized protein n=1 Tax=Gossypium aridum TaxID=34290 RepID=A0A7J8YFM5_GOSAI|nr:hypothetical protein [Gossypium aridum]